MLSCLMIVFQRNGFQVLKKDTPGLRHWQEVFKNISQREGDKEFTSLPRKMFSEKAGQDIVRKKSSQAEGNAEAILVTP